MNMKKPLISQNFETVQEIDLPMLPEKPVSMSYRNLHTDTSKSNLSDLSLQEQHQDLQSSNLQDNLR